MGWPLAQAAKLESRRPRSKDIFLMVLQLGVWSRAGHQARECCLKEREVKVTSSSKGV